MEVCFCLIQWSEVPVQQLMADRNNLLPSSLQRTRPLKHLQVSKLWESTPSSYFLDNLLAKCLHECIIFNICSWTTCRFRPAEARAVITRESFHHSDFATENRDAAAYCNPFLHESSLEFAAWSNGFLWCFPASIKLSKVAWSLYISKILG